MFESEINMLANIVEFVLLIGVIYLIKKVTNLEDEFLKLLNK